MKKKEVVVPSAAMMAELPAIFEPFGTHTDLGKDKNRFRDGFFHGTVCSTTLRCGAGGLTVGTGRIVETSLSTVTFDAPDQRIDFAIDDNKCGRSVLCRESIEIDGNVYISFCDDEAAAHLDGSRLTVLNGTSGYLVVLIKPSMGVERRIQRRIRPGYGMELVVAGGLIFPLES